MQQKKIFLIVFLGISSTWGIAQQAVSSAGGNAEGSGGSANFTIGQVAYSTLNGSGGSAIEGVQQPYVVTIINAVDNEPESKMQLSVFPNPFKDEIRLHMESCSNNYSYRIIDLEGKVLAQERITNAETSIPVKSLAPSTYLLIILQNNKTLNTFKIIKNQ